MDGVEFNVFGKVISKGNITDIKVSCLSNDTVSILRSKIMRELRLDASKTKIFIAFKGLILSEEDSTLRSVDLVPSTNRPKPTIFITLKSKQARQAPVAPAPVWQNHLSNARSNNSSNDTNNRNNTSSSTNNNNTRDDVNTSMNNESINNNNSNNNNDRGINDDDEGDEKCCRLCFSSNENDLLLGRLFRPCRCSGTMKYIHIGCLNQWRAMAPTERSFYQCDQCLYRYNVERVKWAEIVEHKNTSYAITSILLFISMVIVGLITFKLPIANYVWGVIEWNPKHLSYSYECAIRNDRGFNHMINKQEKTAEEEEEIENIWTLIYYCENECNSWLFWKECPYTCPMNMLSNNIQIEWWLDVLSSGAIILGAVGLWIIRDLIWRRKQMFLLTLLQSTRILRIFLLLGIGHAFYGLLGKVRVYVKLFLFRFGEQILEVDLQQQNDNSQQGEQQQ